MARDNAAAVRDTLTALLDELRKPSVTFKAKNEYLQELKRVTEMTAGKYDLSAMYPQEDVAKTYAESLVAPTPAYRRSCLGSASSSLTPRNRSALQRFGR